MTIFSALNERLKASIQRQSISIFEDTVDSVLSSPQKQTCIEREFEVIKRPKKSLLSMGFISIKC